MKVYNLNTINSFYIKRTRRSMKCWLFLFITFIFALGFMDYYPIAIFLLSLTLGIFYLTKTKWAVIISSGATTEILFYARNKETAYAFFEHMTMAFSIKK